MMRLFLLIFFTCTLLKVKAVEVPSEIEFGGMEIKLTDGARRLLQADIEMITRGQKAFQTKVDRADLYFPIIERIFQEEGLPDDFKFLSLQESSLVSDAVSSSKAVGYWQFKKESAVEVGLRVDHHVDERMNIVASSRGAAKYLKRNNTALKNWIYALLSYNLGLGGVKSKVEDKYVGGTRLVIDKDMHWYVIRFLAHKLAYENSVGKNFKPSMILLVYDDCGNKSLHEISKETGVNEDNLKMYNKWLQKHSIPSDKQYYVVLPVTAEEKDILLAKNVIKDDVLKQPAPVKTNNPYEITVDVKVDLGKKEAKKKRGSVTISGSSNVPLFTTINRVKAIKAKEGDSPVKLAQAAGIAVDDFLRYNDMKSFEKVEAGKTYFLQPKRGKATVVYHTVQPGEDLRTISQTYGIKVNSIRNKNRMEKNESLQQGRVLWLKSKRPKDTPVEYKKLEKEEKPAEKDKRIEVVNVKTPPVVIKDTLEKSETGSESVTQPDTSASEVKGVVHVVQAGETMFALNRKYGTPIDSIMIWNNLAGFDLKVGQRLIVDKKTSEIKEAVQEHRVSQGETLYGISRKYGVSVEELKLWNNKPDNTVSIGEVLIIKKTSR